jgi:hypothetical protein
MIRRKTLSVTLILFGTVLLIGCIPWTTTDLVNGEKEIRWRQTWGLKRHSRSDVANRLGEPAAQDDHQMIYRWKMINEGGFVTLCGFWPTSIPVFFERSLVIELDDQGYVKDWEFKSTE